MGVPFQHSPSILQVARWTCHRAQWCGTLGIQKSPLRPVKCQRSASFTKFKWRWEIWKRRVVEIAKARWKSNGKTKSCWITQRPRLVRSRRNKIIRRNGYASNNRPSPPIPIHKRHGRTSARKRNRNNPRFRDRNRLHRWKSKLSNLRIQRHKRTDQATSYRCDIISRSMDQNDTPIRTNRSHASPFRSHKSRSISLRHILRNIPPIQLRAIQQLNPKTRQTRLSRNVRSTRRHRLRLRRRRSFNPPT